MERRLKIIRCEIDGDGNMFKKLTLLGIIIKMFVMGFSKFTHAKSVGKVKDGNLVWQENDEDKIQTYQHRC